MRGDIMIIKKAGLNRYQDVRALYHAVIDGIGDSTSSARWKKDVYPSPDYLCDSIRNGELFIAEEGGAIIGAMVLNHSCSAEYKKYAWPTEANDNEVTVIHALGIHPSYTNKGYAKRMVAFAVDYAKSSGQKVIRLDVLKGNIYAKKLYLGMGFRYLHTLPMFYEDTGLTDFELYEYPL